MVSTRSIRSPAPVPNSWSMILGISAAASGIRLRIKFGHSRCEQILASCMLEASDPGALQVLSPGRLSVERGVTHEGLSVIFVTWLPSRGAWSSMRNIPCSPGFSSRCRLSSKLPSGHVAGAMLETKVACASKRLLKARDQRGSHPGPPELFQCLKLSGGARCDKLTVYSVQH